MSNENNNDEMIERYVNGEMSAPEREEFERLAKSDQRLGRELQIERALTQAIAIDRATIPASHAAMRTRAIDAIARIAPAPVAAPPAARQPALNEQALQPDSMRGRMYAGLFALLLLAIGGWYLTRPSGAVPAATTPPAAVAPEVRGSQPSEQKTAVEAPASTRATDQPIAPGEAKAATEKRDVMSSSGVQARKGDTRSGDVRKGEARKGATKPAETSAAAGSKSDPVTPASPSKTPPTYSDPKATSPVKVEQK